MAEEKLQYQVTFRTRAEGDGAQKVTEAVKDLREEQEKLAQTEAATAAAAEPAAEVQAVTDAVNEQVESLEILQQRDADVEEARRLASERRVEEMEEQIQAEVELEQAARDSAAARVAAGVAIGLVARRSLQLVSETIAQFRSIAPEAAEAFSNVELAIETLTDPIGTLIEGLTGTQTALKNLSKSQAEATSQQQAFLEVIGKKAIQYVNSYTLSIEQATERTNDLAAAELDRMDRTAELESADRRVAAAKDELTLSVLRYHQAINGADITEETAALKRQELARDAEAATAAQTLETHKQIAAYEEQVRRIDELKASTAEWARQVDELNSKAGSLSAEAAMAGSSGRTGQQGDLLAEMARVTALRDELEEMLAAAPPKLADMGAEAMRLAMQYDQMIGVTQANVAAINAELEAKTTAVGLEETVAQNQKLTNDLAKALGDFQATTPAQAEAAQSMAAAVADGRLTTEELARLSSQLQALGPAFQATIEGNTRLVDKLIAEVQALATKQKAQDAMIEGIKNRR